MSPAENWPFCSSFNLGVFACIFVPALLPLRASPKPSQLTIFLLATPQCFAHLSYSATLNAGCRSARVGWVSYLRLLNLLH
ncbi:hypothetical protein BGZ63DRAFT_391612 [Mariannaea sp. PMI_226]|nr:hypothetical protein BGZ63DRAFT_391612 [Mariannaea sp. PMI_226]